MAVELIKNPSTFQFNLPSRRHSESFRNYETSPLSDRTRRVYAEIHTKQCVEFVMEKRKEWMRFDHCEMTVMEAAEYLCNFLDESDPDVDVPNLYHAYQTGESIRAKHPTDEWLVLTGFVHDLGKILATFNEPQYCVVGDTFPVGCEFDDAIVYGRASFQDNPDLHHPVYSTRYGIYEANCGLDKLLMSWGHDEYLYQVLANHPQCCLPEEALYVIRFHSFYPYHTSGAYRRFMNEKDERILDLLKLFQTFDLYSKDLPEPDIDALKPYYESLVEKYIPGKIKW